MGSNTTLLFSTRSYTKKLREHKKRMRAPVDPNHNDTAKLELSTAAIVIAACSGQLVVFLVASKTSLSTCRRI